jgi:hypothetical protein
VQRLRALSRAKAWMDGWMGAASFRMADPPLNRKPRNSISSHSLPSAAPPRHRAGSRLAVCPLTRCPTYGHSHLQPIPTYGRFPLTADSRLRPFPLTADSRLRPFPLTADSHLRPFPLPPAARPTDLGALQPVDAQVGREPRSGGLRALLELRVDVLRRSSAIVSVATTPGRVATTPRRVATTPCCDAAQQQAVVWRQALRLPVQGSGLR